MAVEASTEQEVTAVPEVTDEAMKVRVIAGRFGDVDGAAETLIPVTYLDVHLSAGTAPPSRRQL
mgnify:CR=1 FL=1